jgi:hypothetical protein
MRRNILKMIAVCVVSVPLGIGCLAHAVLMNDPVFALLGFATLLPFRGIARELNRVARTHHLWPTGNRDFRNVRTNQIESRHCR